MIKPPRPQAACCCCRSSSSSRLSSNPSLPPPTPTPTFLALDKRALSLLLLNNRNLHAVAPKRYPAAANTPMVTMSAHSRTPLPPEPGQAAALATAAAAPAARSTAVCQRLGLERLAVVGHHRQDGALKDLLDALHLLAAALHVLRTHLLGHGQPLLRGDGREALCLEHVDARLPVAQVRLEADEDEGRVGAEVQDFGVPL